MAEHHPEHILWVWFIALLHLKLYLMFNQNGYNSFVSKMISVQNSSTGGRRYDSFKDWYIFYLRCFTKQMLSQSHKLTVKISTKSFMCLQDPKAAINNSIPSDLKLSTRKSPCVYLHRCARAHVSHNVNCFFFRAVAVACKNFSKNFFPLSLLSLCPLSQVAADRAEGRPGGQNNGSAVEGLWERI